MQPATNDASALGRLQPCTEAEVGAEFSADIFIANIPSLSAWELRLDYDPEVVRVESADYNQMLVSAQPSGAVFPSLFEVEKAGRHFMAATEINGTPDSGSGVLAHLSLRAIGPGESTLSLTNNATYGPRITGAGGAPIGDDSGDGVWDGHLTQGVVHVGGDCPAATPIPTPVPGSTPGPGNSGGGDGSGSGGSASGDSSVAVVNVDPAEDEEASGSSSDGDTDGGEDSGDNSSESDDGASDDAVGSDGPGAAEGEDEPGEPDAVQQDNPGSDDSGLGSLPLLIGGLALGAVLLGAGTLYVFRRRNTW
jgi:hypothetical protein